MTPLWPSRLLAFLLWLVVFASATYWILTIVGMSASPVRAGALAPTPAAVAGDDLARVLGPEATPRAANLAGAAAASQVDPSARMQLVGVVADKRHAGVALIALDGQPARPYRVGSVLEGGYRLTGVALRSAQLTPESGGDARITLELNPPGNAPPGAPGGALVNGRVSSFRAPNVGAPATANPATAQSAAAAAAAAAAAIAAGGVPASSDAAEKD